MCATEQQSELLSSACLVVLHCHLLCEKAIDVGCRVPETESIFFNLPNLHFLPCAPVTSKVSASVVCSKSEPHHTIHVIAWLCVMALSESFCRLLTLPTTK